jgi:pimeloyl-ACP methyl ester carboxylesterase
MRHVPAHSVLVVGLSVAMFCRVTNAPPVPTQSAAATKALEAAKPLTPRVAPTGHLSNYDESKVGNNTLPDPLVMQNGQPVRDAETWFKLRRPEILKLYETEIFGRVPERAPKMKFEVSKTDTNALNGAAIRKDIVARIGDETNAPLVHVVLYLPTKATAPSPVLLHMLFGDPPASDSIALSTNGTRAPEFGHIKDMLARGYGYASFRYTEIEGDGKTNNVTIARRLALASGKTEPETGEWGTITAWAWGASCVLDYLQMDDDVDMNHVALIGHSRLGKTALWAGARDPRFAMIFASCSGEMGASLARRDFGESLDDVIASFPRWTVSGFSKFAGHWNGMPVDSHMVIALNAPRPVFVTAGTQDLWADPYGQFLAQVAAGPVYRLLGKNDLGTTEMPLDKPLITGELGFHLHSGGHVISAEDWKAFLDFADHHLKSTPPQQAKHFEKKITVTAKFNYLLSLPADYNKTKTKWPLVLFLHGSGESGKNVHRVKTHGPAKLADINGPFPFILVSPQSARRGWDPEKLNALLDEVIKKHRVDKNRVYLTGLSMGGYGTWDLAAAHPEKFAAIAPICGGGDPADAAILAKLPIWVFHGAKDKTVTPDKSVKMVEAIKAAGGNPKFTIYPEAGHDSWTQTYNDPEFFKWLLAQKRGQH